MPTPSLHADANPLTASLSRRRLLGAGIAGLTLAHVPGSTLAFALSKFDEGTAALQPGDPVTWRTWLLDAPDELRPAAPVPPTSEELNELLQLQAERDDDVIALIRHWNSRPAVLPWTEAANAAFAEFKVPPVRQSRAHGMLQTAMYDAVIAAYDVQDAFNAPHPATLDSRITPIEGIIDDRPAYPSVQAAVAGAASTVLAGLLPDAAPNRFHALADEATLTQLQAGLHVRSDIEAGLVLGQMIGERALAHGAEDQPGSAWDGSGRLEGNGYWVPTPPAFLENPLEPLAGTWNLWAMESADQFRPAPPPSYKSDAWESQQAAVQEAVAHRTFNQSQRAKYWQYTSASTLWNGFASDLITRDGLDLPHAARVLAFLGVTQADAQVANYEAKYTYWTARPITADPELNVLFPTPPFPSYPSSHATVSNAGAVILSHFFPEDVDDLLDLAEEAAKSREWAGIHIPLDDDAGTLQGRQVGYLVANVARKDGDE